MYYLVDSWYAIGTAFLPSHKSIQYHAKEYQGANRQATTPQELFNYRHSSLRMVIEQCLGMLKARFSILNEMHSFSQSKQRLIVTACCAMHNFIRMYNRSGEMFHVWEKSDMERCGASITGDARVESGGNEEAFNLWTQRVMTEYCDAITTAIWVNYTANRGWFFWEEVFVENMAMQFANCCTFILYYCSCYSVMRKLSMPSFKYYVIFFITFNVSHSKKSNSALQEMCTDTGRLLLLKQEYSEKDNVNYWKLPIFQILLFLWTKHITNNTPSTKHINRI